MTKILKRKNFINDYLVSSIEYYPKRGIGNVVYSNVHNNNVVFVMIENNMFKSAVRYGVFSKESDKLWGFPIDTEKINIHSSDLAEILKENDAAFSESDISCLRIYNNKARNKILWECYYDDEDHKIAETDANTGEIVRTMDS